ncbi:chaperone protein DnaJ [Candidatus Endolissoclinum faulkneri L5]|uniref:Chaperone protein DnaJ n=1 Tax=Candidatus Endolissoclinum faulkneri L5 TaxID=1401328 RepID=V9TTA7_9PROT|nr:molecular chaperone DnaJ [Candidatus Endolissoclinum faulkneri]AHC73816.1 chaperone protein DnaJ [Candidatus Endolissoclinum faulkneri L5]
MAKRDYYEILGVSRNADKNTLKKAYRNLAMRYHPDRNQGNTDAEHKFKELNEAYDILKDDEKKAAYDRLGHAAFEGGGSSPGQGSGGFADIFEEMFGDFMGGGTGRRSTSPGRGSDLRYNMKISLEDAFNGKQTEIRVPNFVTCSTCDGVGAEKGSKPVNCLICGGRGKTSNQQGFFTIERTCSSCGGAGQVIDNPCKTCNGSGRQRKEKTLSVNIPAGVEDGTRIRLQSEGEAGIRGAAPGDLYLFLNIQSHPIFQREGSDIYCRVPLEMVTASLGGAIHVPTIDSKRAKVAVPSGTQTGRQFRLRGKGMSVLRSVSRGDMYVEVEVETPVNLTDRQRELLEEFKKDSGVEKTSPQSHGFFNKVRELWEDLRY